jgi:ribosomal-protein-alanine N-acetyltransferase
LPYIIEAMDYDDIDAVANIERQCFSLPWPTSAYRRELRTPNTNRYVVARWIDDANKAKLAQANGTKNLQRSERGWLTRLLPFLANDKSGKGAANPYPIVGYAGLWLMVDEAHVTTIAVAPSHQGRGVGEQLFIAMIDQALAMNAIWLTLEVRVSNMVAQALYRKYGLKEAGRRRRYYSDNGEDAFIMWSEPLQSEEFQRRLARLRAELEQRMAAKAQQKGAPTRAAATTPSQFVEEH